MPGHGGNRTYDFWNDSQMLYYDITELSFSLLSEGIKLA